MTRHKAAHVKSNIKWRPFHL